MSKLIKIKQLYLDLGVTRQTIYNWIRDKKIEVVKSPGGRNYITEKTYNSLLNIKNNLEDELPKTL